MGQATAPVGSAQAVQSGAVCDGAPLPLGRAGKAGVARWYLLRVPEGREQAACDRLARLVPAGLADEVFVPRRERWIKRGGVWSIRVLPLWRGYAVAVSRDGAALHKALLAMGGQASPVGASGRSWAPLSVESQAWLASVLDGQHVMRASMGIIADGALRVFSGPLVGRESSVAKIDRHRRTCWVRVCDALVPMPLEVPCKSGVSVRQEVTS